MGSGLCCERRRDQLGIGRFALIREFGLLPCLISRAPGAEAVIRGNHYVDWKSGFAFSKPEGWDFQNPLYPRRTFGGVLVNSMEGGESMPVSVLADPDENQPLVIAANSAVAREIVGAHSYTDDDTLAPILCVAHEGEREEWDSSSSLMDLVESDLGVYAELYRCFDVVSGPRAGQLSGCKTVEFTTKFLFGHQNLPEWIPTRERVMYVDQDPAVYSLHMYDFPWVSPELIQDFDPILNAFRFA